MGFLFRCTPCIPPFLAFVFSAAGHKLPTSLGRPGTASAGGPTGGSTCSSGLAGEAEGEVELGNTA